MASGFLSVAMFFALVGSPSPASACSFAAPIEFVGHVVIKHLAGANVQRTGDVTFADVAIGADCGIQNEMDVSADAVALEVRNGVELYDHGGRAIGDLDLAPSNLGFSKTYPRLDRASLYFWDSHDSTLNAMDIPSRSRTLILPRFPAHEVLGYEVSDARVAWVSFGEGYRFSVYDSVARSYVRENATFAGPIGDGTVDLELVAFSGDNLTLLRDRREVYAYHVPSETSSLLTRLPGRTREVSHHGGSVVFEAAGTLYLHDLAGNATRVLEEDFSRHNVDIFGDVIVSNYYETSAGGFGGILLLAVAGAAGIAVAVAVLRVRRPSGRT